MTLLGDLALLRPGWLDLIEILIVAAILYRLFLLVQRTRAMQILLGLFVLGGIYLASRTLGLDLIRSLLENVLQYGAILALVVFQPELRSALARIGRSRMMRLFATLEESQVADEVAEAVDRLSRSKIGAIIAVEGEVGLDEYAETGSRVEARVSADMLTTIFTPYSPLHDGAVLIRGDQIRCAGAILPLSQYPLADKSLGTRHRAALGLSEETDAIVVVVSEESARVSVARAGRMERDVTPDRLREILTGAAREGLGALQVKAV
ncbi:MAG: diadenylate cyclase CdaA [Longimicrobiales bacterium]|nr:diadenylate cyclase CdaA [Longimicrobiales bacterium]